MLAYDLDDDTFSEILFPGENLLLRKCGQGRFDWETISPEMFPEVRTGVIADFNVDGAPDLAVLGREVADEPRMLAIFFGDGKGGFRPGAARFPLPGVAISSQPLLCAGDKDNDGDPDLVVVSDFYGVDVHLNDGKGHFRDITAGAIDNPRLFGMSHVFADFNADGRCDLYVTGMASTTARRLEAMGAAPAEFPEHNRMRMEMAYGNRIYLGQGGGRFRQPDWGASLAMRGWRP